MAAPAAAIAERWTALLAVSPWEAAPAVTGRISLAPAIIARAVNANSPLPGTGR